MQIDWQAFKDPDGTLVPIEFNRIPFVPKRIFYVCDIPKDEERGNHAHYETKQLLICVQGEIIVKMHNGRYLESIKLKPNQSVLVDKMIWDSQIFLTGNDVLLSICSTEYNKNDYIEDFDLFLDLTKDLK